MDVVKTNKEKRTVQKNEDDATGTGTTESLRTGEAGSSSPKLNESTPL